MQSEAGKADPCPLVGVKTEDMNSNNKSKTCPCFASHHSQFFRFHVIKQGTHQHSGGKRIQDNLWEELAVIQGLGQVSPKKKGGLDGY